MKKTLQYMSWVLMAAAIVMLVLTMTTAQVSAAETDSTATVKATTAADKATTATAAAETSTLTSEKLLPDQDELIESYFAHVAGSGIKANAEQKNASSVSPKFSKTPGRDKLSKREKLVYDYFRNEIQKIARGERESTTIGVPANVYLDKTFYTHEELGLEYPDDYYTGKADEVLEDVIGFSPVKVVNALLIDVPFEFYWYDKTRGCEFPNEEGIIDYLCLPDEVLIGTEVEFEITFAVASEYKKTNTTVDTSKAKATTAAANNAAAIVNNHAGESDYDKLYSYMEEVTDRTDYNYEAASSSFVDYGNPWQLIWVFDNDASTKVVCEGYAKAFKYLCDLSSFGSPLVDAYIATGSVDGGAHMWNLVRMNDGKSYHVDCTFADEDELSDEWSSGSVSLSDYFLRGASKQNQQGYDIVIDDWWETTHTYVFDDETMWLYSDEERTLSTSDYMQGSPDDKDKEREEHDREEQDKADQAEHEVAKAVNEFEMSVNAISSWINYVDYTDPDDLQSAADAVKNTRAEYDALSAEAKAKVDPYILADLEYAEGHIEELKKRAEEEKNNPSGGGSSDGPTDGGSGGKSGGGSQSDDMPVAYLDYSVLTYNGKIQNPLPKAFRYSDYVDLVEGEDYIIKWYTDRTNIGGHSLAVMYIGKYAGYEKDILHYTIKPGKAKLSKLKAGKRKIKLKWKKLGGGVKYQIQYKLGSKAWKTKTSKKNKFTLKSLKSKKKYTVRVRAFKRVNGKKYYGAWSKAKKVTVK